MCGVSNNICHIFGTCNQCTHIQCNRRLLRFSGIHTNVQFKGKTQIWGIQTGEFWLCQSSSSLEFYFSCNQAVFLHITIDWYLGALWQTFPAINKEIEGPFIKYIGNSSVKPYDFLKGDKHSCGEFLSFCQHVQFLKTKGLAFFGDFQGKHKHMKSDYLLVTWYFKVADIYWLILKS